MRNLIGKDTNRDVLIAYLTNPDAPTPLTDKQKQLLNYYVDAYTMIRNYNSVPDAINVLVKLSELRGEKISQATARRYVNDALEVFGYSQEMKAEAVQHLATMWIMDAANIAKANGDAKELRLCGESLQKVNPKIEQNTPNWDLLEPHTIQMMLDAKAQEMLQLIAGKGIMDLDKLMGNVMNSMADDAQLDDK